MFALVTGAGGFLGRAIVEQLIARGDRVRGLGRRNYPFLARLGVECLQADIRDRDAVMNACRGVDVVFHTAAITGIWGPSAEFYDINVQGTHNVIEGCQKHCVPKLVYTSSPSVTFDGRPQEGVDESVGYPRRWLCEYQRTKAIAENTVLTASCNQLAMCAVRPHLIWGERDPHLIPRLIARARAGQLRRIGAGKNRIDMVYVENAAGAHLSAADALKPDSPLAGRAYFISQGEPVNCWTWINEILALAGLPPVTRSVPLWAAWYLSAALETLHRRRNLNTEPRMTRFLAAQLGTSHYFDISRARRDFGYVPLVSTSEGMCRLAASLNRSRTLTAVW